VKPYFADRVAADTDGSATRRDRPAAVQIRVIGVGAGSGAVPVRRELPHALRRVFRIGSL
jgi:hypothetical protein